MADRRRYLDLKGKNHDTLTLDELFAKYLEDETVVHDEEGFNFHIWENIHTDESFTADPDYLPFETGYQYPAHAKHARLRQLASMLSEMRDNLNALLSDEGDADKYSTACNAEWNLSFTSFGRQTSLCIGFFAEEWELMENLLIDLIDHEIDEDM